MSHYTIGTRSRPDLQRYARKANEERSAALRDALAYLRRTLAEIAARRGRGPGKA